MIGKDNASRAVALYDNGFLCALPDGHHKAYAAAKKGCVLPALVIIPMIGICTSDDNKQEYACFSEIEIPFGELSGYTPPVRKPKQDIAFEKYSNRPVSERELDLISYPTIEELTGIYAIGEEDTVITKELIISWLKSRDKFERQMPGYVLKYYAKCDAKLAYMIAETIIGHSSENEYFYEQLRLAYRFIVKHKCSRSEQIVTDYIVNHDSKSHAWDICCSYWDDEA